MPARASPRTLASWLAGAAASPIAVPRGAALEGYAIRATRSTHVLDPLFATAFAVAAPSAEPVVLVSADVIAVDRALATEIARVVGLGPGRTVVCATHTHSGPAGLTEACAPSGAPVDAALRATVADACAVAAKRALAELEPADLRLSRAESTGVVANRVAPRGARDRRVTVLSAARPFGRPIGAAVLVACHPTLLGPESTAVSADLAGAARAVLGGAPVAALTGAAADVSTRFTRRSQDAAELKRLGRRLAAAAKRALADVHPLEPVLGVVEATLELPRKPARPEPVPVRGEEVPFTLAAWRIGSSAWLFAPGELSVGLGTRIEASSAFADTAVVGYAGGYAGYLVEPYLHERDSYEARASPFAAEAAAVLVAAAGELLAGLR